jgi:hypothetical protein
MANNLEGFPTEEDWLDLWDESEHEFIHGPIIIDSEIPKSVVIEPDYDSLNDGIGY